MFKHRFVFAEDQTKFLEEVKTARKLEEEKIAELIIAEGRARAELSYPFYEGMRKYRLLSRD
jgi:hypothetical protein